MAEFPLRGSRKTCVALLAVRRVIVGQVVAEHDSRHCNLIADTEQFLNDKTLTSKIHGYYKIVGVDCNNGKILK
jgi:hypothetical protein